MTDERQQLAACKREIEGAPRKVRLPEACSFADVFASWEVIPDLRAYCDSRSRQWGSNAVKIWTTEGDRPGTRGQCVLSEFCSVYNGAHHLKVKPTSAVLDMLPQWMLIVDRMTLNFEIIPRDSGTALIVCKHSLISGGAWIAIIPQCELPAGVLREQAQP